MGKEEIKINLTPKEGEATTEKPVVILTGNALEPRYPESVNITGILSAPADFLEKKKKNYAPNLCHLLVDKLGGKISFITDEKVHHNDTIVGKLSFSNIFKTFKINTGETFGNFELATLFRTNKYWFASPEEHEKILHNLNNFSASVEMKVKQMQNNNGNMAVSFEREVRDIAWKREFRLSMPIFEGYERKLFNVEIGVTATDRAVKFFLESNEVYELVEVEKEKLIGEQVKRFEAFGCSIVRLT